MNTYNILINQLLPLILTIIMSNIINCLKGVSDYGANQDNPLGAIKREPSACTLTRQQ